jgi:hypothetical protein
VFAQFADIKSYLNYRPTVEIHGDAGPREVMSKRCYGVQHGSNSMSIGWVEHWIDGYAQELTASFLNRSQMGKLDVFGPISPLEVWRLWVMNAKLYTLRLKQLGE